jgi:hypothetical protein
VLSARLVDAAGAAISGASIRVAALHTARANDVVEADLERQPDGEYAVRLPVRRAGQWELRFEAVRGDDRFTSRTRLEAYPLRPASHPDARSD